MGTKILAIETSTDACSAALLIDDQLFSRFKIAPQKHTELILPMIQSLLQETDLKMNQLNAIAFTSGPGSFTGVRLGLSVVQGLAFGNNLPVISISTLQALARVAFDKTSIENVLVIQDARMSDVYWGAYKVSPDNISILVPDSLSKPKEIEVNLQSIKWVGVGTGWNQYKKLLPENIFIKKILEDLYPDAAAVAKLAIGAYKNKLFLAPEKVMPYYLRDKIIHC